MDQHPFPVQTRSSSQLYKAKFPPQAVYSTGTQVLLSAVNDAVKYSIMWLMSQNSYLLRKDCSFEASWLFRNGKQSVGQKGRFLQKWNNSVFLSQPTKIIISWKQNERKNSNNDQAPFTLEEPAIYFAFWGFAFDMLTFLMLLTSQKVKWMT